HCAPHGGQIPRSPTHPLLGAAPTREANGSPARGWRLRPVAAATPRRHTPPCVPLFPRAPCDAPALKRRPAKGAASRSRRGLPNTASALDALGTLGRLAGEGGFANPRLGGGRRPCQMLQ